MTTVPKTLASDLIDELNEHQANGKYLVKDSLVWKKLKRDAEKVIHAEPPEGWSILGMVYAIVGEADEVERCFGNALRLRSDATIRGNLLASYAKLGLCTKAAKLYSDVGDPANGVFADVFNFGMNRGAFQSTVRHIEMARNMELDMTSFPVEIAERSALILQQAGLSDEAIARHLDAAGTVLRERRVFEVSQPGIIATDVENVMTGVTMVLYVRCDPSEIFAFNLALAQKEEELEVPKNPAFDVVFAALA